MIKEKMLEYLMIDKILEDSDLSAKERLTLSERFVELQDEFIREKTTYLNPTKNSCKGL